MIKITSLFWIAVLVIAGGTVMRVSYQVRHVQEHLAQLDRDTGREQASIRILTAEWDTLNDPGRIDTLSKRYLSLESTPIRRIVSIGDIPFKMTPEQIAQANAAARKSGKGRPTSIGQILEASAVAAAPSPSATLRAALPATAPSGKGVVLVRAEHR